MRSLVSIVVPAYEYVFGGLCRVARTPVSFALCLRLQELQEEVDSAREAWLRKQRSARDRASKEGRESTGASRQVHRALKAADAARKAVAEAELDLSEAQYNVQRCGAVAASFLSVCCVLRNPTS